MDFGSYAQHAVELVNADLPDLESLRAHLDRRPSYAQRVQAADLAALQESQPRLRAIFQAGAAGDDPVAVERVNDALALVPISPRISGHDASSWHLHVTSGATPAEDLLAEAYMGLAVFVIEVGADRLGVCADAECANVYLDTSPNRSRRYCSDRCSSRANVAAYRARQRALSAGDRRVRM